uniref:Uncharacterized protein n=1 Tax=Megaselia scalaris TaxID=36166 RepID=T1GAN0_MEGSC
MERSSITGLDNMSDSGLCLQDLVGNTTNTNGSGDGSSSTTGPSRGGSTNNSATGSSNSSADHLHSHHNMHDTSSTVSVSPTVSGILPGVGLSHIHHSSQDLNNHHGHHGISISSHTPNTVLHEPLEKLKKEP